MTELRKEDIPVLDFIINELCKPGTYSITCEYLAEKKVFGFGEIKDVDDLKLKIRDNNNFEIIAGIIEKSGKAKVTQQLFENPLRISKNSETLLFKKEGGFKKEFEKQEKNNLREIKKDELLDLNVALKRFESKIGRKLMYFTILISFLSFLITVLTLEFWQTDENKNEQKNRVENPLLNKKEEIQKDTLN